jgi:hypothetical protein
MKFKNTLFALCSAAVLTATSLFADDAKKAIIGTWSDADGVETVEYKADGTMTETLAGGDVIKARYSFPDAAHIKVEFEGPMSAAGPVVSPFKLNGDQLDVTGVDGTSVMHYKRGKADAAK